MGLSLQKGIFNGFLALSPGRLVNLSAFRCGLEVILRFHFEKCWD